jgi:hypothetical protein
LSRNESGRFGALKSDSTHHFFRNACTKSGMNIPGKRDLVCDQINSSLFQKIRVITKLPNSEQSYKGKVKTHKYINTDFRGKIHMIQNIQDPLPQNIVHK